MADFKSNNESTISFRVLFSKQERLVLILSIVVTIALRITLSNKEKREGVIKITDGSQENLQAGYKNLKKYAINMQ